MVMIPAVLLFATPALLRHLAMGEAQRDALALMSVPPEPLPGDNAFLWLATADHDVPESMLQAAIDQDNLDYKDWIENHWGRKTPTRGAPMYAPLQASTYPARPRLTLSSQPCVLGSGGSACLALVLARPAATRQLIDAEAARLENVRRVLASGHVVSTYHDYMPFVTFDPMALELTASALEAAEGRVPAAMQRTCRLLAWGREQSRRSTDWTLRSQLQDVWQAASSLLLDLRQTYPAAALPVTCLEALAPASAAEFEVCGLAREEFRRTRTRIANGLNDKPGADNPVVRAMMLFLSDEALGDAWLAQRHAPFCSDAVRDALATGSALPEWTDTSPAPLACAAALMECERMRLKHIYASTIPRNWDQVGNALATQRLLDAAHARVGQGDDGQAPTIPGYEVRHDPDTPAWKISLRYPERPSRERIVRLAGLPMAPGTP